MDAANSTKMLSLVVSESHSDHGENEDDHAEQHGCAPVKLDKCFFKIVVLLSKFSMSTIGPIFVRDQNRSTKNHDNPKCTCCTIFFCELDIQVGQLILYLISSLWVIALLSYFVSTISLVEIIEFCLFLLLHICSMIHITSVYNDIRNSSSSSNTETKSKTEIKRQILVVFQLLNESFIHDKLNLRHKILFYIAVPLQFGFVILVFITYILEPIFFDNNFDSYIDTILSLCSVVSAMLYVVQIGCYCLSVYAIFALNEFYCKQLLSDLSTIYNDYNIQHALSCDDNINENDTHTNIDIDLNDWFDEKYHPKWQIMERNLKDGDWKWYKRQYFGYMMVCCLNIWVSIADLEEFGIFRMVFDTLFVGSILYGFVACLCESTKTYYKIKNVINKMLITSYARNNDHFWKKGNQCLKCVSVCSMKGQIYGFELSWLKVFRLTFMFAVTRILFYILEQDYRSWDD